MKIKGWVIAREGYRWPDGIRESDRWIFEAKKEADLECADYFVVGYSVRPATLIIEEPKRKGAKR